MQLVKNVFLTRNKTIGRKLEELLIVWIIENKRLAGKDRMFEVYLNVIEWGPGVYGVQQASRYYFDKPPADLTLQESLFLAGIVPFPKRYKSVFENNGCPRAWFGSYMQRMKDLMVARNRILPADTAGVDNRVLLTGPASQIFVLPDTLKADTLQPDQFLFPFVIQ
jgi:membrane peptidoglycan carboxypeptidase